MRRIVTLLAMLFLMLSFAGAQTPKQLWAVCGPDSLSSVHINDLAADTSGNTYYTGYTMDSSYYTNTHFLLIKVSYSGVIEWVKRFPFVNADSFEVGKAIAVDFRGDIYVAGSRADSFCNICTRTNKDINQFVIKYSPAGDVIWINRFNGPNGTLQVPEKIVVSANRNIFVTGTELKYNPVTFDDDMTGYVQRISWVGKTVFTRRVKELKPAAITLDNNMDVIIGGRLYSQGLYQLGRICIAKYGFNGDSMWQKSYYEYDKNGGVKFLKTDGQNSIYVQAETDTIDFYNAPRVVIMKYTTKGVLKWINKEAYRTYSQYATSGLVIDKKWNVYSACNISDGSGYNRDWVVSKYNTSGIKKWTYTDTTNYTSYPMGIVCDELSNTYITGVASKPGIQYAYGTLQLDSNGHQVWFKNYSAGPKSNNFVTGIVRAGRNFYVGGNGVCVVKYGFTIPPAPRTAIEQPVVTGNILSIYPNPAVNYIQLKQGRGAVNSTVIIYNSAGKLVLQQPLSTNGSMYTISIDRLAPGLYFLKTTADGKHEVVSFIKR